MQYQRQCDADLKLFDVVLYDAPVVRIFVIHLSFIHY